MKEIVGLFMILVFVYLSIDRLCMLKERTLGMKEDSHEIQESVTYANFD